MFLKTRLTALFLSIFLLVSCSSVTSSTTRTDKCHPPENFNTNDLIGTWESGLSTRHDTIVFKEDGTYSQTTYVESASFDGQTNGQWWVENTPGGIPYLHVEGMSLCVYWEGVDCNSSREDDDIWYDFCEEKWRETSGEGIFLILPPPQGFEETMYKIRLFSLQKSTEGVSVYDYQP